MDDILRFPSAVKRDPGIDAINAAKFDGRTLPVLERRRAARWIAGRQGLPGAYAATFAGFPSERSNGIVLFTGERIASASARHILREASSPRMWRADAETIRSPLNRTIPCERSDRKPANVAA